MKTILLFATAMIIIFPLSAEAHKVKRNCMWTGQNIFRLHSCQNGESQPRATPSRSVAPQPPDEPDKPDCEDDDKDKD